MHHARPQLRAQGVVYAGRVRQHADAALALTGHRGLRGYPPPTRVEWDRLVRQVGRATDDQRVVVSSEFFGEADVDTAREAVAALGGDRVRVLITLRPLTKIMPSAWQQYVRNGHVTTYDDWLEGMLRRPPYDRPTPSFWRRHHHDALVEKWASVVGPENLTVLVVDENDKDLLTHSVEAMLGLPVGMLQPEPGRSNRSLTWGEIELVRQLNLEFRARKWPDALYRAYVFPMTQHLQDSYRPGPDEPRITTPQWALERAAEIGAAAAEKIAGLGVRVIGDLEVLGALPAQPQTDSVEIEAQRAHPDVPAGAAKDAVVGVIAAAAASRPAAPASSAATPSSRGSERMRGLLRKARTTSAVSRLEERVRPLIGR